MSDEWLQCFMGTAISRVFFSDRVPLFFMLGVYRFPDDSRRGRFPTALSTLKSSKDSTDDRISAPLTSCSSLAPVYRIGNCHGYIRNSKSRARDTHGRRNFFPHRIGNSYLAGHERQAD